MNTLRTLGTSLALTSALGASAHAGDISVISYAHAFIPVSDVDYLGVNSSGSISVQRTDCRVIADGEAFHGYQGSGVPPMSHGGMAQCNIEVTAVSCAPGDLIAYEVSSTHLVYVDPSTWGAAPLASMNVDAEITSLGVTTHFDVDALTRFSAIKSKYGVSAVPAPAQQSMRATDDPAGAWDTFAPASDYHLFYGVEAWAQLLMVNALANKTITHDVTILQLLPCGGSQTYTASVELELELALGSVASKDVGLEVLAVATADLEATYVGTISPLPILRSKKP